jgi:hypothetical protein
MPGTKKPHPLDIPHIAKVTPVVVDNVSLGLIFLHLYLHWPVV